MMSDLSSAEYELLHDLLDTTPSLEEELRQHQLTLEQAKAKLAAWQEQAASLLKLASLPIHNKFAACQRLADTLDSLSEDQALWLYTLLLSDNGLVFDPYRSERTEEQNLLSYLAVEKKRSHLEKTLRHYQALHAQFSKLLVLPPQCVHSPIVLARSLNLTVMRPSKTRSAPSHNPSSP